MTHFAGAVQFLNDIFQISIWLAGSPIIIRIASDAGTSFTARASNPINVVDDSLAWHQTAQFCLINEIPQNGTSFCFPLRFQPF